MNAEIKLPRNVEAEAALLGAMMVENRVIDSVADAVLPTDFYEPLHGRMFDAIVSLFGQGKTVNPVTMKPLFDNDEAMKALGGVGYMAKLTESSAGLIGARDFAAQIKEMAERRRILTALEEARVAAIDTSTPMASLSSIVEQVVEVSGTDKGATEVGLGQGAAMLFAEHKRGGGIGCRDIQCLDKLVSGLKPKQMMVVAGRPGMGKTAVAVSYSMGVASQNIGVLFITKEMSFTELTGRCLSDRMFSRNPILYERIANGWMNDDEQRRIEALSEELDRLPFQIIDSARVTPAQVNTWVRRWKRRFEARGVKLGLVVIDYLQLMEPDRDQGSRYANITYISGKIKQIAKEHGVPIMALAQLSRDTEKRDDKKPRLADLKDTGAIEQDADMILLLLREEYYLEESQPEETHPDFMKWEEAMRQCAGQIKFIMAKKRDGRTGTAVGQFHGKFQAVRG